MPPADRRVIVIRRRYLGDVVLLGSLLRNLRLAWPDATLAAVVEPRFADVLKLNPDINAILPLPARLREWPQFVRRLRRAKFTHVLDLDNTEKTAAIARLSGAGTRVALHHGGYRVKLRAAYTHIVHDPTELHEHRPITDYYLRALEPIGVPLQTREVILVPPPAEIESLQRVVGAAGKVVLVHPGSRSPMRLWPAENFAEVCDFAQEELGVQVVLAGGPAETSILNDIRARARTHLLTPPPPPGIGRFAALARLSHVLLCHDSGPMHVAAAVGTPVVALYGSQNAALFRPVGTGHTLLQPPLPCVACVAPARCVPGDSYHNLCVRNVTVDRVKAALRECLRRPRRVS
jgi:ADP-heptose:LPS heptosyltransferase